MNIVDFLGGIRDDIIMPILTPIAGGLGYDDETVYQWALLVQRAISDENLPPVSQLTAQLLTAILQNRNVNSTFQQVAVSGPRATARKFVEYAESTYVDGLPLCEFKSPPIHTGAFKTIATNALTAKGYTVVGDYETVEVKIPILNELAIAYLQDTYNYTNSVVLAGDTYVYLTVVNNSAGYQAKLKRTTDQATTYLDLPDYDALPYTTYYIYSAAVTNGIITFEYKFTLPFHYAGDSDEYPEMVESVVTGEEEDLTKTLPIIALRKEYESIAAESDLERYTTTKDLLEIINIDLVEVLAALEDSPDIDNVSDAFFMCGVSLYSETPDVIYYLYFYFRMLYDMIAPSSYEIYTKYGNSMSKHYIKFTEDTFNLTLKFNYIRVEYIEEVIGSINTMTKTITVNTNDTLSVGQHVEYTEGGDGTLEGGEVVEYPNNSVVFKKQITATHCEKLTIQGISSLINMVHSDGYEKGLVQPLVAEGEEGTQFFHIPLSNAFLDLFPMDSIEKIILESFNYVCFASVSEYIEWYRTEAFAQFVTFIIIVIALYYFAVAEVAAGEAGLIELIKQLLVQYALKEIFKSILDTQELTNEQTAVLIIAYAYVSVKAGGSGFSEVGMTVIEVLDSLVVIGESVTYVAQSEVEDLLEERKEEQTKAEEMLAEQQAVRDAMGYDSLLDPLDLITETTIRYEPTKSFYDRTLCRRGAEISLSYPNTYATVALDVTMI